MIPNTGGGRGIPNFQPRSEPPNRRRNAWLNNNRDSAQKNRASATHSPRKTSSAKSFKRIPTPSGCNLPAGSWSADSGRESSYVFRDRSRTACIRRMRHVPDTGDRQFVQTRPRLDFAAHAISVGALRDHTPAPNHRPCHCRSRWLFQVFGIWSRKARDQKFLPERLRILFVANKYRRFHVVAVFQIAAEIACSPPISAACALTLADFDVLQNLFPVDRGEALVAPIMVRDRADCRP